MVLTKEDWIDGKEEAHSRRDCREATAGRCADGTGQAGRGCGAGDRSDGSYILPLAQRVWLAGGGVKAGLTHGATDEMGFHVVQDEVHVHDLQATILHCLGFDHERLTYTYQGRQFRLTDVHGHVVEKILG
jgi:hypothetical protein